MDFGKTQIGNMTFVKYKKAAMPFIKVSTVSVYISLLNMGQEV